MSKGKIAGGAVAAALVIATPLIAKWEGRRNDPYDDVIGVKTVCYGETRVAMRRYSDAECLAMLKKAVEEFMGPVLKCTPILADKPKPLAAATSFSYNIGSPAYCRSTAARLFNAGDIKGGCKAMSRWTYAGGRKLPGLVNRRADEVRLCLEGLPHA